VKKTLAGLYELTQFNKHIYFMMIASLLGLAASRGQFNWRFFILLPANILTVSFVILSAIITFFLINLIPNWTLFLMVGLSLIFIIPSVLNFKKGAAHRPTLGLFRKPIERTIALTYSLVSYCPG